MRRFLLAAPHGGVLAVLGRWDDGGNLAGMNVPDLVSCRERIARLVRR